MAKTSFEIEQEFLQKIKEITGKSLPDWLAEIKTTGMNGTKEILEWLKKDHAMNHSQAFLLAGIYNNNGNPVYADETELLNAQFGKNTNLRPLYDAVVDFVLAAIPDTIVLPKKTYVSLTLEREYAAIAIKSKEIRLGMDLGDRPFDEYLQASKSLGAMPRISHMTLLTDASQLTPQLKDLLLEANKRVNKK